MLPDGARYYDKDQCCFRLQRYDACSQMGQDIMTKINVVSGCSVMMPAPRWGKI